jgi:hypothetical protein
MVVVVLFGVVDVVGVAVPAGAGPIDVLCGGDERDPPEASTNVTDPTTTATTASTVHDHHTR